MAERARLTSGGVCWPDLTTEEAKVVIGTCLASFDLDVLTVEHAEEQVLGQRMWSVTADGISLDVVQAATQDLREAAGG